MLFEGFETERLCVLRWPAHRPSGPLGAILTPAVVAHLPPGLQKMDPEQWIADQTAQGDVYAVEAGGVLIGLLLLAQPDAVHVGYLLAEAAWGKGYASELLRGLVVALRPLAPMELHAGVEIGNPASARVLEKAGFSQVAQTDMPDMALYQLSLP